MSVSPTAVWVSATAVLIGKTLCRVWGHCSGVKACLFDVSASRTLVKRLLVTLADLADLTSGTVLPAWWLRLPGLSQAYDVAAAGQPCRDRLSVSATVWLLRCGQCCGQWCCGKGRQSRCPWSE